MYLTALARERELHEGRFLPTSQLLDEPFSWPFGNQVWSPGNYNDRYYGNVSLRRALEQSLNAATARLAQSVGLKAIHETARRLGFVSPLPLYPSMVLGSAEVTPYEVANAFSTLANQGIRVTPKSINRVVNQDGETLERRSIQVEQVIPPDVAYMVTHLMEGVIEHGTARGARRMGFVRPAAGKTGTTNDYGDAWFAGFTPDLVAVVWVGFDHRESLKLSGGQAALPIWTEFMKRATEGQTVACFSPPPGIRMGWGVARYEENPAYSCPTADEEAFYADEESYHEEAQSRFRTVPIEATAPLSSPMGDTPAQPTRAITSSPSAPAVVLPSESADRKPWWRLF